MKLFASLALLVGCVGHSGPPPVGPEPTPAAAMSAQHCAQGSTCAFQCPNGGCDFVCATGSTCAAECDGGRCHFDCQSGATCNAECNGGHCVSTCEPGAVCSLECNGGGCQSTCAPGSTCATADEDGMNGDLCEGDPPGGDPDTDTDED